VAGSWRGLRIWVGGLAAEGKADPSGKRRLRDDNVFLFFGKEEPWPNRKSLIAIA